MTVNDAITKLKVMLGASEETVVNLKFAEATLVDGTQVYSEGELEPGAILFVRAGEGADEDPFAPAGIHETTDGLLITVGENGEIESVESKGEELTPTEEQETFEDEVEEEVATLEEEVKEEVEMAADEMIAAIAELIKGYMEEVTEVKEELSALTERFNSVADMPAAKKVSNTFSENAATRKSVSESRLEQLIAIRNKK
jgi:hypothetical protein